MHSSSQAAPRPNRTRSRNGARRPNTQGRPQSVQSTLAQAPRRAPGLPKSITPPRPVAESFAAAGIATQLVNALGQTGITTPSPIQAATLNDTVAGRDVLGCGRTGSGKTLAFVLPMISRLDGPGRPTPGSPRGLVLVPTRELANQVDQVVSDLARLRGLRTTTIYGGIPINRQINALRRGVDIVVACPGRLEDLIRQGACKLDEVEITVLDEADHMADLGFLPSVKRILDLTPAGGQRMLFSATLDNDVDVLVRRYLNDPAVHSVDPPVSAVSTMRHHVFVHDASHRTQVIRELAAGQGRSLLFTRTKHQARKLAKQLTDAGIPAVDLHGNLAQNARERNLEAFGSGRVRVLVATDIAARGIHIDDIELVIHIDPPAEHKAYLHRSGRTARAGSDGDVVTLATRDQQRDVAKLARQAGIDPTTVVVTPGDPKITELTGPPAEFIAPAPRSEAPAQPAGGGRGRGPRGGYGPRKSSGGSRSGGSGSRSGGSRSGASRSSGSGSSSHSAAAFSGTRGRRAS